MQACRSGDGLSTGFQVVRERLYLQRGMLGCAADRHACAKTCVNRKHVGKSRERRSPASCKGTRPQRGLLSLLRTASGTWRRRGLALHHGRCSRCSVTF